MLLKIIGKVKYDLFGPDGVLKQQGESHNLVVDEGDDWFVEALVGSDAASLMASAYAHLGTGYSVGASGDKAVTWLTTALAGDSRPVWTNYPQPKVGDANVLKFLFTFGAGESTSDGIDEIVITSERSTDGTKPVGSKILSFSQITPVVNKQAADILNLYWEITLLGA